MDTTKMKGWHPNCNYLAANGFCNKCGAFVDDGEKYQWFAGDSEDYFEVGPFDTATAAVKAAQEEFADRIASGEVTKIYVGVGTEVVLTLDGDSALDAVENTHQDEVHEDAFEAWCRNVSSEARDELGERLTKVLHEWLDEQKEEKSFDCIDLKFDVDAKTGLPSILN